MFGPVRNPNMIKGQENLSGSREPKKSGCLASPNSSGSMVCAAMMEYLDTI